MKKETPFVFKVTARHRTRAGRARMKNADKWVTLVRSVRTGKAYLWDVEEKREVSPDEQERK